MRSWRSPSPLPSRRTREQDLFIGGYGGSRHDIVFATILKRCVACQCAANKFAPRAEPAAGASHHSSRSGLIDRIQRIIADICIGLTSSCMRMTGARAQERFATPRGRRRAVCDGEECTKTSQSQSALFAHEQRGEFRGDVRLP
jgi:hypothetical protein